MQRNVIIACSAQKKGLPKDRLIWNNNLSVSEWISIYQMEDAQYKPDELYNGQHFLQQQKVILKQSDHMWIASAGLGLLDGGKESKDRVTPYDAAFTKNFGAKPVLWPKLSFGTLNRLLHSKGQIVIAVPIPYQNAIISDQHFNQLSSRIVVLGPGPLQEQDGVKKTPYHPRMIEIYGGQKLALFTHLLESYYDDPINFSKLLQIKNQAKDLPPPPTRKKFESGEELRQILLSLPDSVSSGPKAVRYIRDHLERSCSQERILFAWKKYRR